MFSIAVDEKTDVNDITKQCVEARYIVKDKLREELCAIIPMHGTTGEKDVSDVVKNHFDERGIDLNKLVSIMTDGAPSMTGVRKRFNILENNLEHPNSPGSPLCKNGRT